MNLDGFQSTSQSHGREQFAVELSRIGGISPWFSFLLLLSNLPGFCIGLLSVIFIKDEGNLMVLCQIKDIKEAEWSLEEKYNITRYQ